jgi:hypothetical protein
MQTVDLQKLHDGLREQTDSVVAAVQKADVAVISHGKVVAILTRPPELNIDLMTDEEFGRWREERLSSIKLLGEWDSTKSVSEDRDRG